MFGKLALLAILALGQGRPDGIVKWGHLESHELCPPAEVHFLLPHEYDCSLFYYCEYGLKWKHPRKCARGTEFSFDLQVCVHPYEANCTLPGYPTAAPELSTTNAPATTTALTPAPEAPIGVDSEESGEDGVVDVELLPNGCPVDYTVEQLLPHADCNKFYQCAHGEKVEMSCPLGEHYNAAEGRCDWAENSGCDVSIGGGDGGNGENSGEDSGNGETDGGDNGNGEDGGDDSGNGSAEVDLLPNGCPVDGTVDLLLPHANCRKFYQCVHGEKVEMRCPRGEHFNAAIQACDWPANAGCAAGGGDGGNGDGGNGDGGNGDGDNNGDGGNGDGGNGDGGSGDGGNGDGDNVEVDLLPNGCPADGTVDLLLPHADCRKFYQCVHGEKVQMRCPRGEHFNAAIQACDWPANAGCAAGGGDGGNGDGGNGDGGNGDGDNNGGEDNGDGGNGDGGNGDGDIVEVDLLPNGCPADGTVNLLLPHADCRKFYQCVHGEKVQMRCPRGEHFNAAIQACDWPTNAGCAAGGGDGGNGDGGNGDGGNGDGDNNGGEDNGDGGNSDGGNGDGDNVEVDLLPNGCPADGTVDLLLPHADCRKFYQCVHGKKVQMRCPRGEHFNAAIQACDWPANAGCAAGGGDGGNGDGGNGDGGNGDGDNNGGEDNGDSGDGDGGNGDGDNVEFLPNGCPADFSIHHLLPHATDCSKFFYCVWGELVESQCRPGTHFNPTLQVCDWPWKAGCANGDNGGNGDGGNGNGENGNRCADGCNVLPWGHSTDCDKYWLCNGEVATLVSCSEGLKFNAATRTCDLAINVSC